MVRTRSWCRGRHRRVTPDVPAHSFNQPRPRPAPSSFTGSSVSGDPVSWQFEGLTLVVAIKPSCDGCRDFVFSPLDELRHVAIVVISASSEVNGEWRGAARPIVVAPELVAALDIRWPPCYVLVDPEAGRVVTEGVVLGPSQVALEIAPHLRL